MLRRDEADLIERAAAGDMGAFAEIVRVYQAPVYVSALSIVRERAAAQDIAQETFLQALGAMGSVRKPRSLGPWLRTIARNLALNWLRGRKRTVPLEDAAPRSTEAPNSGADEETEGFESAVRGIVLSLSPSLRVPLLLCYLDDVPTATAARYLGLEPGTLRKRLHDGKKKLQRAIVALAEKTLQEYRLPRNFAEKCVCRCRRAERPGRPGTGPANGGRKEVIGMEKKSDCGCGCLETKKQDQTKPAAAAATKK